MDDPYQVLEVPREATTEEIKKAYRKKAKKLHPDAGGNEKEMARAVMAYAVLSDPGRREKYDTTGDCGPDTTQNAMISRFMQLVLNVVVENDCDVEATIAQGKKSTESQYRQNLDKIEHQERQLKRGLEKIIKAPEPNMIAELVRQQLGMLADERRKLDQSKLVEDGALAMFDAYQFSKPEMVFPGFGTLGIKVTNI